MSACHFIKDQTMKTAAVLALVLFAPGAAFAQAPAAAPAANNCISQYEDMANASGASLFAAGYTVAAAVPGGLWLQKGKELTYCNAARAREGEVICWKLREPLKGQACS
jgi:hypothetical protein